jgi:hypothetical protein
VAHDAIVPIKPNHSSPHRKGVANFLYWSSLRQQMGWIEAMIGLEEGLQEGSRDVAA